MLVDLDAVHRREDESVVEAVVFVDPEGCELVLSALSAALRPDAPEAVGPRRGQLNLLLSVLSVLQRLCGVPFGELPSSPELHLETIDRREDGKALGAVLYVFPEAVPVLKQAVVDAIYPSARCCSPSLYRDYRALHGVLAETYRQMAGAGAGAKGRADTGVSVPVSALGQANHGEQDVSSIARKGEKRNGRAT